MVWPDVATADPVEHWPRLADALNVLVLRLIDAGRVPEAVASAAEAIAAYRRDGGDRLKVGRSSLPNLAGALAAVQARDSAVDAHRAALDVLTAIPPATVDDAVHRKALATGWYDLINELTWAERGTEVAPIAPEAIAAWRRAAAAPGNDPLAIGTSNLPNLAANLTTAGARDRAVDAHRAALDVLTAIPPGTVDDAVHHAAIAMSWYHLVTELVGAGRGAEVAPIGLDSIAAWRRAATAPGANRAAIATSSLPNLAFQLTSAGFPDLAAAAEQAAADILATLPIP